MRRLDFDGVAVCICRVGGPNRKFESKWHGTRQSVRPYKHTLSELNLRGELRGVAIMVGVVVGGGYSLRWPESVNGDYIR